MKFFKSIPKNLEFVGVCSCEDRSCLLCRLVLKIIDNPDISPERYEKHDRAHREFSDAMRHLQKEIDAKTKEESWNALG